MWRERAQAAAGGARFWDSAFAGLLDQIEGAIIFSVQPPENTMKKWSYSLRQDLIVKSFGNRGDVPKQIDTSEH